MWLISDPDAVELSWRDADVVPPLKVKLPDVELKPVPEVKAPVLMQDHVKAIVIGSQTLKELFRYDDDDYLTVYIVDSKGITKLIHEDGRWRPVGSD